MEGLKIAIVMDPVEQILIDKDTTFALALEAQSRGFTIDIVAINDLVMRGSEPWAYSRQVEFRRASPCFRWLSDPQLKPLDDFDLVLQRKDPPFDERYFFSTHFLSLCKHAKVLNRPSSLRNAPEKVYSLLFPQINPPSTITSQASVIRDFMEECGGEIIIKPLNKCGGAGIIYLHQEDKNFNSIIELSTQEGRDFILAQKYLPEIRNGDKRVICVNGTARGAILRIPSDTEHRGNIHVGGRVEFCELTPRDQWLTAQIEEQLRKDGLYFVGLDIIGDYITEINVTSPTGIQEILQLGGIDIAKQFWDEIGSFQG